MRDTGCVTLLDARHWMWDTNGCETLDVRHYWMWDTGCKTLDVRHSWMWDTPGCETLLDVRHYWMWDTTGCETLDARHWMQDTGCETILNVRHWMWDTTGWEILDAKHWMWDTRRETAGIQVHCPSRASTPPRRVRQVNACICTSVQSSVHAFVPLCDLVCNHNHMPARDVSIFLQICISNDIFPCPVLSIEVEFQPHWQLILPLMHLTHNKDQCSV